MMEESLGYHQLNWEGETPTSDKAHPEFSSQTHCPRDLRLHPNQSCGKMGGSDTMGHGPLPPVDTCSCIYLSLIICGAAFLLPYNSFITAVDFYQVMVASTFVLL